MGQPNGKYLYLHIPRTGGTSIQHYLLREFGCHVGTPINPGVARDVFPGRGGTRVPKMIECGHISWLEHEDLLPEHKPFTVIRDPRERILSLWGWMMLNRQCDRNPMGVVSMESPTMRDFVYHPRMLRFWGIRESAVYLLGEELKGNRRRLSGKDALSAAKEHLKQCVYWECTEFLDETWPKFAASMGATGEIALGHQRTSLHARFDALSREDQLMVDEATYWERQLYEWALAHRRGKA